MSYAVRKPGAANPRKAASSPPSKVSPSLYFVLLVSAITPSAPSSEQTKYMFSFGSYEDGGQLSPPEAEFGVRLIVFGSVDIGWEIFEATIFGFGFLPPGAFFPRFSPFLLGW